MGQPLVSVIIPNYNSIRFIEATLNSVFEQTYPNIEVIVVDDGSADGSFELISQLNRPSLKLVRNPSKGACAARNHGLDLAKGEYIQFLDADDLLSSEKIEKQVVLLVENPKKVAVCSTNHFYETVENGIVTDTPFLYSTENPYGFLLKLYGGDGKNHNMVAQHAWLTPKTVMDRAGAWNEKLIKDQDGEFFCRVVLASNGICFAENVFCHYRKHRQKGNVSSGSSENHLMSQLESLNTKAQQLAKEKKTQSYKNAMALQYKIIAIGAYPQYKKIYRTAMQKVEEYGGSTYEPVLGGKTIEAIKTIFGWRAAKAFSALVHKII